MTPPDHWHEAIAARHSYRSYKDIPVEEEALARLEKACAWAGLAGARAVIVRSRFDEVSRGIAGSYGRIDGAPAYAAFIGDTGNPWHEQLAGYLGEGVVLEAVSIGLSTCWVGGFFFPRVVATHVELAAGEKVLAVTPLGYRKEHLTRKDRLFKTVARSRGRKPVTELTTGLPEGSWPGWARAGLESARLAPSVMNRQPWRFAVADDAVTLSVDSPRDTYWIPKRLDCGIAMLHFELGALRAGFSGRWMMLDPPAV
ncbi:MAG: nitroreductase, partial [Gaiellales bacterium]